VDARLVRALAQGAFGPLADPALEALAEGEPYRRFLHALCKQQNLPALELGVDGGRTSALMAAAGFLVIGVDSRGLDRSAPPFHYPNFRFLFCDSLGARPVVAEILGKLKLGIVFQDSSHHAEPSRLEWEYYKGLLAPGAVWVCDDVTPSFKMPDEPRSMVDYFEALPGRKLTFPDLHVGNVIGVVLA